MDGLEHVLDYVIDTRPISNLAPFLVANLSVVLMYLARSRLARTVKDSTRLFTVLLIFVAGHVGLLMNMNLVVYYGCLVFAALRPLSFLAAVSKGPVNVLSRLTAGRKKHRIGKEVKKE